MVTGTAKHGFPIRGLQGPQYVCTRDSDQSGEARRRDQWCHICALIGPLTLSPEQRLRVPGFSSLYRSMPGYRIPVLRRREHMTPQPFTGDMSYSTEECCATFQHPSKPAARRGMPSKGNSFQKPSILPITRIPNVATFQPDVSPKRTEWKRSGWKEFPVPEKGEELPVFFIESPGMVSTKPQKCPIVNLSV